MLFMFRELLLRMTLSSNDYYPWTSSRKNLD